MGPGVVQLVLWAQGTPQGLFCFISLPVPREGNVVTGVAKAAGAEPEPGLVSPLSPQSLGGFWPWERSAVPTTPIA